MYWEAMRKEEGDISVFGGDKSLKPDFRMFVFHFPYVHIYAILVCVFFHMFMGTCMCMFMCVIPH